jgi:hypothetical protein
MMLASAALAGGKQAPPRLMLWSWYQDDDFRKLLDRDTGVAYRGLSLQFEGQNDVTAEPRMVPVRIAPETYQMLVVRFDYRADARPSVAFSPKQRQVAVKMIAEMMALAKPRALQIDFDALQSARPFYRQLLTDIRAAIGPDVFLSLTALVSWCDSPQSWMAGLPVDEIVPMAFNIGQARGAVLTVLRSGGQFAFGGCRESLGVEWFREPTSIEMPVPRKEQRAYVFFGFDKWSASDVQGARLEFRP